MSFIKLKTKIDENDTVIIYLSAKNMHAIDVTPTLVNKRNETVENVFQTSFGALKVKDLIGVEYGSKIKLTKGWAYVLQANPELWTQTLPHRTQIIYTPDISMILFQLEIKPGSIVVESGTGSGSLSHYFIRAIKPHGHLHTFDFHEIRANQAREEFEKHGLKDLVTVHHMDVCENGFTNELNEKADAVFLDLPSPHIAVQHALKALKSEGGRFCSFSPCIEQSQKCCKALQENGFSEIKSMELLQIEDTVKTKTIPIMDLEFLKYKKEIPETDMRMDTDKSVTEPEQKRNWKDKQDKQNKDNVKILTSTPPMTMAGHTGYLTFATLQPAFTRI